MDFGQDAGIEPVVRWDIVSGIMSSWKGKEYLERPQDAPFVGAAEPVDVINHCAWGSVCNAGARIGKFVPDAHGVARWAIYVRPDSSIVAPEDLADIPIAVNTFKTLWVVPPNADPALVDTYFRVLQRADADLERDLASCLPLWRYSIPTEFRDRDWDFSRFDGGECFFYAPLQRDEFDELVESAQRWGLDDYMQARSFDELAFSITA